MSIKSIIRRIVSKFGHRVYTDEQKCDYLRSLGAKIGNKTRFIGNPSLGSEPYLVEIGENCLISDNVLFITHDGGVKVLNAAGFLMERGWIKWLA